MLNTHFPLKLRKLSPNDKSFFFQLYNNLDVLRFISNPKTENEILAAFESRLPVWHLNADHWLCLVIENELTGQSLGLIGFCLSIETQYRVGEIGYMIDPQFSGKGIATRALNMLLSMQEYAQIRSFMAVVVDGNIASEKVLINNGFTQQKIIVENYEINGFRYDDICYELMR